MSTTTVCQTKVFKLVHTARRSLQWTEAIVHSIPRHCFSRLHPGWCCFQQEPRQIGRSRDACRDLHHLSQRRPLTAPSGGRSRQRQRTTNCAQRRQRKSTLCSFSGLLQQRSEKRTYQAVFLQCLKFPNLTSESLKPKTLARTSQKGEGKSFFCVKRWETVVPGCAGAISRPTPHEIAGV